MRNCTVDEKTRRLFMKIALIDGWVSAVLARGDGREPGEEREASN